MNRPMRRQKCEVTDPVKIEQIIKKAGVVHLGMVDEGKAYIVPLYYGYIYKDIFIRMEDLRYICMAQRKDANMT